MASVLGWTRSWRVCLPEPSGMPLRSIRWGESMNNLPNIQHTFHWACRPERCAHPVARQLIADAIQILVRSDVEVAL